MIRSSFLRVAVSVFGWLLIGKTHAQTIDESLVLMVAMAKQELNTPDPTRFDPVALNARLVWSEDKGQLAIVMKVNLLADWHIYASVSKKSPFIPTQIKLMLPGQGLTPLGEWEKPYEESYDEDANVYVGEELLFVRYYKVDKNVNFVDNARCGLYYQACDPFKCLPPRTKVVVLN